MSVEMILMQDVKDLGVAGQVVKVADGYARNFLVPNKLAASVTESTRRQLAKLQIQRDAEKKVAKEKARDLAAAIQKGSYTIRMKGRRRKIVRFCDCLLYTSDAADE